MKTSSEKYLKNSSLKKQIRARETAQQMKHLTGKPDNKSSMSRSHKKAEGEI